MDNVEYLKDGNTITLMNVEENGVEVPVETETPVEAPAEAEAEEGVEITNQE